MIYFLGRSLRTRLLATFSFATVALVLLFGAIAYTLMVSHLEKSQETNLIAFARYAAREVDHAIRNKQLLLAQIARAREVEDFPVTYRYLPLARRLAEYREDFPEIGFFNADGNEEVWVKDGHTAAEPHNILNDPGFIKARENPGQVIVERHPTGDALVFTLGLKEYFGDVFVGGLHAVVPLDGVMGHLGRSTVGQTGFFGLLDDRGNLFKISKQEGPSAKALPAQLLLSASGGRADGAVVLDESLGLRAYSAYAGVDAQPWLVTAVLPYQEFAAGPNQLALCFVGVGLLLLLAGSGATFYLGGRLSRPLRQLVDATHGVANGRREEVDISNAPGEIGELGKAFNEMTASLKRTTVSRDYLDNVLDSMHESLVVVGLDGRIERVNRATCEMLGYAPAELLGQPFNRLLPEDGVPAANWVDQITRSAGHFSERLYRSKAGDTVAVTFSWARFNDPDGRTHGIVCLAQNQGTGHRPSDWRRRMRAANGRSATHAERADGKQDTKSRLARMLRLVR